jgi:uncharacterized membrane protein
MQNKRKISPCPTFLKGGKGGITKSCILYLASCIVLCLFISTVSAQDFTIKKYHSDITISQDSSFMVKEIIDVEFHRMKHGIYREIPYKYADDFGKTIKIPLKVISVTDVLGKEWKYSVSKKGNLVYIRIGDPNKYLEGNHTYVITYEVENALLYFNDHDELYWNVTGNEWKAEIREVSAAVTLTSKDKSANLWAACYTGVRGSRSSECSFETSNNIGEFSARKRLNAGEGLTIAFGWDKGLVSPPSAWKKFLWFIDIRENWIFAMPFFSLIIMINIWRLKGRDPRVREAVTVRYEPPKYNNLPLTPGEVGTLIDEKLDSRDITSTIVGLAVKGYIKIEESKTEGLIFDSTDFYLAKVKAPDDNLSNFETILMSKIFTTEMPGRMVSDMKNQFYKELDLLKKTLYGELISKRYFLVSPEKIRSVYVTAGIFLAVLCSIVFALFVSPGKGIVAGILAGFPVIACSRVMPAKTQTGASAYMDILGFQEFMERAEKDQLERMRDKDLFSRFLPYAIALDVVDNWAKAFEGIYQEQPQWYGSQAGFRTFNPYHFSRSINSATSSLASAMYSAPRSSGISGSGGGFGGGGSSGGGFGGGGGGSW